MLPPLPRLSGSRRAPQTTGASDLTMLVVASLEAESAGVQGAGAQGTHPPQPHVICPGPGLSVLTGG